MNTFLLFQIILTTLGIFGFVLAFTIWHRKSHKKPLICPLRLKCEAVIGSKYAKFFGIPLEVLGMVYYGFIIVSHVGIIMLATPGELVLYSTFMISLFAFCFSSYLIFVQGFILKQWCSWCIMSAIITLFIFIVTVLS